MDLTQREKSSRIKDLKELRSKLDLNFPHAPQHSFFKIPSHYKLVLTLRDTVCREMMQQLNTHHNKKSKTRNSATFSVYHFGLNISDLATTRGYDSAV